MLNNQRHETREAITLENEGQRLFGVLHRPLVADPCPAVLFCHGLAGHKTGRYRIYVDLAEALTAQGIAVFRVDFRGSGDSEGAFGDMTLAGEVSDALLSLSWLKNASGIDPKRVGIFGRSLGGAVAVITAAEFQEAKSLALWAPIFSGDQWRDMWKMVMEQEGTINPMINHEELRTINGQVAGMPFFQELFNMELENELAKLKDVPLLHIHGLKDDVVYPAQANGYKQVREGSDSKFYLYDESDHDFSFIPERRRAITETSLWFKNTL